MSKGVVLCVDDEAIILNSLREQLSANFGHHFNYEFAESAEDAMELIEELIDEDMDILMIVSDWLMPGIKGDELLIRVHKKYPNIQLIMLSGQVNTEAIDRAKKEAEILDCLDKPWNEERLINLIRKAMDNND